MAPGSRTLLCLAVAAVAWGPLAPARAEDPPLLPLTDSNPRPPAPAGTANMVDELRPAQGTIRAEDAMDLANPGDMTMRAKPNAPKPNAPKPKLKKTDLLPPLRSYKRATLVNPAPALQGAIDPADPALLPPTPTTAVIPAPTPRRRIPADDDPYQPLGIDAGNLRLLPYVEQDIGSNSNPLSSAAAKGSLFSTTEAGVALKSNWSRDEITGELKAGYNDYLGAESANAPYGSGKLDGRVDVTRDISLDAEGRFNLTEAPVANLGLAAAAAGAANPLLTQTTYGLTVGGERRFGNFSFALHGSIDEMNFQNVALAAPATGGLANDDYADWTLKARAGYRVSEFVQPFVEFDTDARRYGDGLDVLGYQRNSVGNAGLIGVTLGSSQKLMGEISAGYGERQYQDTRLASASSPLINASLVWSPTALTTVTLKTQTLLLDALDSAASADIARSYSLDLSHSLTRQIMLGLNGVYVTDNDVGTYGNDRSLTLGARAEYHLNRDVVLKASASHTDFQTTLANSNYTSNVFLLGIRFQR